MRRTLTISLFLVIAIVAMIPSVVIAGGYDASWSMGITLSEKDNPATLGSRIDAKHGNVIVGSWFSSSNALPNIVRGLMSYSVFSDFSGIRKVERVELSPDHGKTVWKASLVEGNGYSVDLPENLSEGSHALEWGVWSKDKENRLVLWIIPINWTSVRQTSSVHQIMVLFKPLCSDDWTNDLRFACLRGFVSSQAMPDMGYLNQKQAMDQALNQMMQPAPQPVPQPAPACVEPPKPACVEPQRVASPPPVKVEDTPSDSTSNVDEDGYVPTNQVVTKERAYVLSGTYRLLIAGQSKSYQLGRLHGAFRPQIVFSRKGCKPVHAEIVSTGAGKVYAELEPGGVIQPGAQIIFDKVEGSR